MNTIADTYSANPSEEKAIQNKSLRSILWIGIVSIVMLFAALTSAYIIRLNAGNWMHFELPSTFYISTLVIVLSSATMWWSYYAVKLNRLPHVKVALFLTLVLGFLFVYFQFKAWADLVDGGVFFVGNNVAGSFLYVLTGLHLAHLGAGILALLFTFIKALLNKYHSKNLNGIYLCSTYWHFLTILWVYLLLFLIYIR